DAIRVVRTGHTWCGGAVREHRADGAAPEDLPFDADHGVIGGGHRRAGEVRRLHVEEAKRGAADLAGEPASRSHRHHEPNVETDSPAEEQERRVAAAGGGARAWPVPARGTPAGPPE